MTSKRQDSAENQIFFLIIINSLICSYLTVILFVHNLIAIIPLAIIGAVIYYFAHCMLCNSSSSYCMGSYYARLPFLKSKIYAYPKFSVISVVMLFLLVIIGLSLENITLLALVCFGNFLLFIPITYQINEGIDQELVELI